MHAVDSGRGYGRENGEARGFGQLGFPTLAASPEVEGMTGKYLVDRKVKAASDAAYDETTRKGLWEASEELTGLKVTA